MKEISQAELDQWAQDYATVKGGAYYGDAYKHFMAGMKHIIEKFMPEKIDGMDPHVKEFFDKLMGVLHEKTFHMTDEEAKPVIDMFLNRYRTMLHYHNREWYYKNV